MANSSTWTATAYVRAAVRQTISTFSDRYGLTTRERDVVFLLASGVTHVAELATILQLRPNTVHNHLKGIFRRTGTRSKSQLLAALLLHALDSAGRAPGLSRRPRVLLLDACRTLAEPLAALGMQVHEASAERGFDMRPDVVVASWDGQHHANALRERLDASLGAGVGLLHVASTASGSEPAHGSFRPLPLQADRVGFEILLLLSDDPYERSRLTRIDEDIPAVVHGCLQTRLTNVGFGGAFVELPPEALKGPEAVQVGENVEVAMSLSDEPIIRAHASVVWTRAQPRPAWPAGMGVRFTHVAAEDQRRIEDFVRLHRMRALLPASARASRPHAAA